MSTNNCQTGGLLKNHKTVILNGAKRNEESPHPATILSG